MASVKEKGNQGKTLCSPYIFQHFMVPSFQFVACQAKCIHLYENLRAKVQRCCANTYYNRQCLKQGVIPKYVGCCVEFPNDAVYASVNYDHSLQPRQNFFFYPRDLLIFCESLRKKKIISCVSCNLNTRFCTLHWKFKSLQVIESRYVEVYSVIFRVSSDHCFELLLSMHHSNMSLKLTRKMQQLIPLCDVQSGPYTNGVHRIFFGGGCSINSIEDRGQRERESGGGSPLVKVTGGSCNLVKEISLHIVKFS